MGCTSSSQATQQQAPGSRQVSRGGAASPPPIGISQPIQKPKPYRYGSQITLVKSLLTIYTNHLC